MGIGFENCEEGFGNKLSCEKGLVSPLPFRTLLEMLCIQSQNKTNYVLATTTLLQGPLVSH